MSLERIIEAVRVERERQDIKWGEQNHDPFLYLCILGEEVGEANQAALNLRYRPLTGEPQEALDKLSEELRAELIQVAAVAVAAVECIDRGKWEWGGHAR